MEPEEAWRSSKLRAWGVGFGLGALFALIGSLIGLFAGSCCCLFQFANALTPILAGLLGGLTASGVGRWTELTGMGGPGAGAMLGLRGGATAAIISGLLGFLVSLLVPLISAAWSAYNAGGDIAETLIVMLVPLLTSMMISGVAALGGVVVGIVFGGAAGAIMGGIRGK